MAPIPEDLAEPLKKQKSTSDRETSPQRSIIEAYKRKFLNDSYAIDDNAKPDRSKASEKEKKGSQPAKASQRSGGKKVDDSFVSNIYENESLQNSLLKDPVKQLKSQNESLVLKDAKSQVAAQSSASDSNAARSSKASAVSNVYQNQSLLNSEVIQRTSEASGKLSGVSNVYEAQSNKLSNANDMLNLSAGNQAQAQHADAVSSKDPKQSHAPTENPSEIVRVRLSKQVAESQP